jgi:hypothetical protein
MLHNTGRRAGEIVEEHCMLTARMKFLDMEMEMDIIFNRV